MISVSDVDFWSREKIYPTHKHTTIIPMACGIWYANYYWKTSPIRLVRDIIFVIASNLIFIITSSGINGTEAASHIFSIKVNEVDH
jgi:hypothetical protein